MPDTLLGGIAINEILVDPNGSTYNFDTDGDGTAAATDEYVEIVNTSGTAIDISGLELWDAGVGNWFTFPSGTVLQPGAHALVMTGVQSGGSLPTGDPDDLFFDVGRGSALINNGGDNVVIYDPTNDEYITATFNGDAQDDPTLGAGGYSGFSSTATQSGSGEDFGNDTDGLSLQRLYDSWDSFTANTPTPGTTNVCFCQGTMIKTPTGEVPVDALKIGDIVLTADNEPQPVRWIYAVRWTPGRLRQARNLAPVRIQAGALGNGLPKRDLYLSQQHRVLVQGKIAQRIFSQPEVLVAAKHLCRLDGVDICIPPRPISYYHVMTSQHEVLFAEGARAESLYLGPQSLKSIPDCGIAELERILGRSLADLERFPPDPARPIAKGRKAKSLIERHRKNAVPVMARAA